MIMIRIKIAIFQIDAYFILVLLISYLSIEYAINSLVFVSVKLFSNLLSKFSMYLIVLFINKFYLKLSCQRILFLTWSVILRELPLKSTLNPSSEGLCLIQSQNHAANKGKMEGGEMKWLLEDRIRVNLAIFMQRSVFHIYPLSNH